MIIAGAPMRVAVLRQKLAAWKDERRDAANAGQERRVAACDISIAYFRTALSQEHQA